MRTKVPSGLDPVLTVFLDDLAKPIDAQADLSGSATLAQVITKINDLLAAMRARGRMEQS